MRRGTLQGDPVTGPPYWETYPRGSIAFPQKCHQTIPSCLRQRQGTGAGAFGEAPEHSVPSGPSSDPGPSMGCSGTRGARTRGREMAGSSSVWACGPPTKGGQKARSPGSSRREPSPPPRTRTSLLTRLLLASNSSPRARGRVRGAAKGKNLPTGSEQAPEADRQGS